MSKNPIIVFEGIEGTGKSHHIKNVANFLNKKKRKFICIREPGGSKNSEKIRNLILNNKSTFNKNTDLLLYLSARSENIELIKKNTGKKIILIDRFVDSTIAYQHFGMGVNFKLIMDINNYLLKDITINFTFLNVVNKRNMLKRLKSRKNKNKYDNFNYNFYNKVQKGFLKIANKNRSKYLILDSNKDNLKIIENKLINKIEKIIK